MAEPSKGLPETHADACSPHAGIPVSTEVKQAVPDNLRAAGFVVVERRDVYTAWSWAAEAIDDLPEDQQPTDEQRPLIEASLQRLSTALRETARAGRQETP